MGFFWSNVGPGHWLSVVFCGILLFSSWMCRLDFHKRQAAMCLWSALIYTPFLLAACSGSIPFSILAIALMTAAMLIFQIITLRRLGHINAGIRIALLITGLVIAGIVCGMIGLMQGENASGVTQTPALTIFGWCAILISTALQCLALGLREFTGTPDTIDNIIDSMIGNEY